MQDYHIHSSFSGDCNMPMEEACKKAINLGLSEIAFTDHIDLDWPDDDIIFEIMDLAKYDLEIKNLQDKYSKHLIIKKGIELGLQPHTYTKTKNHISGHYFDYIIASIHCIDCFSINKNFFLNKTTYQAYLTYFNEVLNMIKNFEHFCCLGHIDVIRRYNPISNEKNILYNNYCEILDEIFKILISKNKGLEVNTSGYKYKLNSFNPTLDFLLRFKELGGKIVTVGSDAHNIDYVGYKIKDAIDMIKQAGFKYIVSYNNMHPSFIKI